MNMKKHKKGEQGYIRFQHLVSSVRTVILFALALGLYAIGYINTGTNKNLLTVVAILGILPASRSCVNMIMFLRYKSLDKALYESLIQAAGDESDNLLYENVLTTTEKSYFLPAMYYRNHTIIAYCENKANEALGNIEAHVKKSLKLDKIDTTVKVFKDRDQFTERLGNMLQMTPDEDDSGLRDTVYSIIKAISL